ncbi:MAG: hypothetical protein L3J49_15120, partial [Desulfobulbaceae bacterium]|nr:hypothetical protein [Desulfobulbaceae bacterium]
PFFKLFHGGVAFRTCDSPKKMVDLNIPGIKMLLKQLEKLTWLRLLSGKIVDKILRPSRV